MDMLAESTSNDGRIARFQAANGGGVDVVVLVVLVVPFVGVVGDQPIG